MKRSIYILGLTSVLAGSGCSSDNKKEGVQDSATVKLITLDPGHFHSALVQKSMYDGVSPDVHVYAPEGQELQSHLKLVDNYNKREADPTKWNEKIYTGADFFEKMLADKSGNVVVIAGNNQKKTEYISRSVDAGFNVLADKPMAIDSDGFNKLVSAFETAEKNKVLLYDIMTERYEITSMLQKEIANSPEIFGQLVKGTVDNPAVVKRSVHHFYKNVSGAPLVRPSWFFDVNQQGEGLVDITTHMVDLIQWACFPDSVLDYKTDIEVKTAKRWPTTISRSQFEDVTQKKEYPSYLSPYVSGDSLGVYSNGEINYTIKGIHANVSVTWDFKAPEGTGDTHYSIIRGTKADAIIMQGKDEAYKPVLYVKTKADLTKLNAVKQLKEKYKGLEFKPKGAGLWEVFIPAEYKVGHEEHFAQVTKAYLSYLKAGKLPDWEVPNMLAKYYTTTQAREIALKSK
ncbi:MAG: putative oxidoreductase C-terminal domain-containing protein [Daejeonella sp.]